MSGYEVTQSLDVTHTRGIPSKKDEERDKVTPWPIDLQVLKQR